jgi:hypothetical protein
MDSGERRSYATLEAFEFCKENVIIILSVPPHTSHWLQPMDIIYFGPQKEACYEEHDLYMESRHLKKLPLQCC